MGWNSHSSWTAWDAFNSKCSSAPIIRTWFTNITHKKRLASSTTEVCQNSFYNTQLKTTILLWTSDTSSLETVRRSLHKVNWITVGCWASFNIGRLLTNRSWEMRLESEWDELNPKVSAGFPFAACNMMKFEWQAVPPIYFEQLFNTEAIIF